MDEETAAIRHHRWKESGQKGPSPGPLLGDSEIPEWLNAPIELSESEDESVLGFGKRKRGQVRHFFRWVF